jgi:hypothetical protein
MPEIQTEMSNAVAHELPHLLTIGEVAAALRVDQSSVYKWTKARHPALPPLRRQRPRDPWRARPIPKRVRATAGMTALTTMYSDARRDHGLGHLGAVRHLARAVGVDEDTIARTLSLADPSRFPQVRPKKEKS